MQRNNMKTLQCFHCWAHLQDSCLHLLSRAFPLLSRFWHALACSPLTPQHTSCASATSTSLLALLLQAEGLLQPSILEASLSFVSAASLAAPLHPSDSAGMQVPLALSWRAGSGASYSSM